MGEDCWCVDPKSGHVEKGCLRHRAKRSLYTICQDNRVQQLEAYYEFVSMGRLIQAILSTNPSVSILRTHMTRVIFKEKGFNKLRDAVLQYNI